MEGGDKVAPEKAEQHQKSSNKLRMKALVGWNTLYQVPEMINLIIFFTRLKNAMDKEDKNALDSIDLFGTLADLYGTRN